MWSNEFENHKKVDRNALMRCMSAYMYACMYVCMNECTCHVRVLFQFVLNLLWKIFWRSVPEPLLKKAPWITDSFSGNIINNRL